ncbi:MAG TPA: AraC family transcriptional regulator [Gammaproteobacteria bacterium]|nr:AraC family transcriptional regulator [Gammaproteobacteria bacterium]
MTGISSKLIKAALLLTLLLPLSGSAQEPAPDATLDAEIRALRQEIIDMNSELQAAEQDFLFPASTRLTVFVSMDTAKLFDLRSVEVRLDDRIVAHHIYSEREVYALQRGGMHQIYIGSIAPGQHELVAYFLGTDHKKRDYRRGVSHNFVKSEKPQFTELKITNIRSRRLPEFDVRIWE